MFYVVAGFASLRQQADAVTRAHCCVDCCVLSKLGYEQGKEVIYDCMLQRDGMSRVENKNDLRALIKVSTCILFGMKVYYFLRAPRTQIQNINTSCL